MSISTYAELSTAIANWTHRADLTSVIPDFISLGEDMLNRELRLSSMENSATVSTSIATRFGTLPTGFNEIIDLAIYDDNYPQVLNQVPLSAINYDTIASDSTGRPESYAVSSSIVFNCVSDQVYSCAIRYYKDLDLTADLTNSVLTRYPEIYLHASLYHAYVYMRNDEAAGGMLSLLRNDIRSANRKEGISRGKVRLRIDSGLNSRNNGDILTGQTW